MQPRIEHNQRNKPRDGGLLPPALRYPAYRAYWFGLLASVSGFQMFRTAQFWLIYQINDNPLYLGYVGAAAAIPGIVFNLFGGVFADKVDKRRLIMGTQVTLGILIGILGVLVALDMVTEYHVLAIAFLAGSVEAFDTPARQALYPRLIDRSVMISAVAMNSAIWQGTRIVAPAIAGVIIALQGVSLSLFIAGAGPVVMAFVMFGLHVPHIARGAVGSPLSDMFQGLKFIKGNSIFSYLITMTFFNSFFGMAYVVMMPEFATEVLGRGPGAYGTLLSVGGVGSLMATIWITSRKDITYRGLFIVGGATMFGLCVTAFAVTSHFIGNYFLALAIMFIAGIFNSVYMISIQSSLQMMVPDSMRGRVMGFYGMTWSIMPLGGMQASGMTSLVNAPFAIAVGGIAVVTFALGTAILNSAIRKLGSNITAAPEPAAEGTLARNPSSGDGDS